MNRWETQYNEKKNTGGLFNGNISWMVTDLAKQEDLQSDRKKGMQAMLYRYDQLHRITQSRSLTNFDGTVFTARASGDLAYDETFSYDGNGNLQTLNRWDQNGVLKDEFAYKYYGFTNKLYEVHPINTDLVVNSGTIHTDNVVYRNITLDGTSNVAAESDVELSALQNIKLGSGFSSADESKFYGRKATTGATYEYDEIGNLVKDNEKGVEISWNPQGKVTKVDVHAGESITTFRYDAMGNRVEKKVVKGDTVNITRYLRDASGNVMTVYNDTTMIEQPIYGSSRLGQYTGNSQEGKSILGLRRYELSNHLGNVLTVISDNIFIDGDTIAAKALSTSDYYPFGLAMTGRMWSDTVSNYRYGFNGKEKDNDSEWGDASYDYGFRIYNPAIAKFLSVDPLTKSYPWYTPYQFAGNSPIRFIDLDGLEPALPEEGKKNLLIVVQGWGQINPDNKATQVDNAGMKSPKMARDFQLGAIEPNLRNKFDNLQGVTFASSSMPNTIDDIAETIKNFKAKNPNGKVIAVGHSLGAENLIKMSNQYKDIGLDLLITLDPRTDKWLRLQTENEVANNVKNSINYWQTMTGGISGVELEFGEGVNGANVQVFHTSHTEIDSDLQKDVESDVSEFLFGRPVVKKALILPTIDISKRKPNNDKK